MYNSQATAEELAAEQLVIENTLRPELAELWCALSDTFDIDHITSHASPWSQAKMLYSAALTRQQGLRMKVSKLELVWLL